MIALLRRLWKRRQRKIDTDILWPALRQHADTLERAQAAMLVHVSVNQAWSDLAEDERIRIVRGLR